MIRLGTDAICWHERLAAGELDLLAVIDETARLGADFVQTSLDYARVAPGGLDGVAERAGARGLALQANGGPIGRRYFDANRADAVAGVGGWLEEAKQLGCPSLMVHSGVYLPELAASGSAAEELDFVAQVLSESAATAADLGVSLLFENASDFTATELLSALVGCPDSVGIFLDLTNPHNVFENPALAISRLAPRAPSGHVKDFILTSQWTGDHYHRRGYSLEFRYPGEGTTDLRGGLQALVAATAGRDFALSIEGLDSHVGVSDQGPRLHASLRHVGELLAAAGAEVA